MAEDGLPSRVRGDHGTENLLVAAYMERERGVERDLGLVSWFIFMLMWILSLVEAWKLIVYVGLHMSRDVYSIIALLA